MVRTCQGGMVAGGGVVGCRLEPVAWDHDVDVAEEFWPAIELDAAQDARGFLARKSQPGGFT